MRSGLVLLTAYDDKEKILETFWEWKTRDAGVGNPQGPSNRQTHPIRQTVLQNTTGKTPAVYRKRQQVLILAARTADAGKTVVRFILRLPDIGVCHLVKPRPLQVVSG